jgi:hypothetical protein
VRDRSCHEARSDARSPGFRIDVEAVEFARASRCVVIPARAYLRETDDRVVDLGDEDRGWRREVAEYRGSLFATPGSGLGREVPVGAKCAVGSF